MPKKSRVKGWSAKKGVDAKGRKRRRNRPASTSVTVETTQQSGASLAPVDELLAATEQFPLPAILESQAKSRDHTEPDLSRRKMVKRCIVPNCKSADTTSCKEKVALFTVPKSSLQVWRKMIPYVNKPLVLGAVICEKHFRKKDVVREVKTSVYTYELKRPKLKPNAIPIIFSACTKYKLRPRLPECTSYSRNSTMIQEPCVRKIKLEDVKFLKKLKPTATTWAEEMKEQFLQKYRFKRNPLIFTKSKYDKCIEDILKDKSEKESKKQYDVLVVDGVKKIIAPMGRSCNVKFYVHEEELFDVLHDTHISMKHAKRQLMLSELRKLYKNITSKEILIYLYYCPICKTKKKNIRCNEAKSKKVQELSGPLHSRLSEECDIDIIDYQLKTDGEFKFILIYQNCLTKFCIMKPLKTTSVDEIFRNLCDIFIFIGVPSVVNSSMKNEVNEIFDRLKIKWPKLQMPQNKFRWRIDVAGRVVDNLEAWMERKQTKNWSKALRFVQLSINRDYHQQTKKIPYETLFGSPAYEEKIEDVKEEAAQEYTDQMAEKQPTALVQNENMQNFRFIYIHKGVNTVVNNSTPPPLVLLSSGNHQREDETNHFENQKPIKEGEFYIKEECIETRLCEICVNNVNSEGFCRSCERKSPIISKLEFDND